MDRIDRDGVRRIIGEIARRESESWFRAACRDPHGHWAIGIRPGAENQWGDARITRPDDIPAGYQVVDPRPITGFMTQETVRHMVAEILDRTPIIPILLHQRSAKSPGPESTGPE